MISQIQEFVSERTAAVADKVQKAFQEPIAAVREAASGSAGRVKSLKQPVRVVARSGIRLTSVSQATMQSLIELQSEAIQSAIGDAALRLERASRAASLVDLIRAQVELLPATRERMGEDARRAAEIVRSASRDFGAIATQTFERVAQSNDDETPAKAAKRTTRRPAGKTAAKAKRARKAA
jgi:phasin family protein